MYVTDVDLIAVSDNSVEYSDDDRSYQRTRRAAARQQVNYHEISDSDTAASDQEQRSASSWHNAAVTSAKECRRIKDSDSEYQPSSEHEDADNVAVASSQMASRCKRLGSGSDESGSAAISKKKGRLNRIMSSSDYSSSDDDNPLTDDDKTPALNSDHHSPLPIINGKHQDNEEAVDELNAASENSKAFAITSLLKTSDRTARSDKDSESSEENDFADSLSGIEDLVDYVTQS